MKDDIQVSHPAQAAGASRLAPILQNLRTLLPGLREQYGVETLEVFGSRVRGEELAESDLDLLVTFRETPGLLKLIALENEISDRLGMPVDLVMRHSLKPRLRNRVLSEAVAV